MTNGSGSDYTSILDKTDWRKTIHKALEEAVLSIGKGEEFWYNVEQAIQAMSATYPNWDATTEVKKMVYEVKTRYNNEAEIWVLDHIYEWAMQWNRGIMETKWKNAMYMDILQHLQNIAGKHRMLLWGIKRVPTGKEINDVDEDILVEE